MWSVYKNYAFLLSFRINQFLCVIELLLTHGYGWTGTQTLN